MMSRFIALIDLLAGLLLGSVILLTFFEAVLRYLFNTQIPDAYSFSGYAQGVAIFWGIASATYAGRHICVDILWDAAGRAGRLRIDIAAALISGVYLVVLSWMTIEKVIRSKNSFEVTNELRFSVWIFLAVGAAGIVCAAILAFVRAWRLARGTQTNDGASL